MTIPINTDMTGHRTCRDIPACILFIFAKGRDNHRNCSLYSSIYDDRPIREDNGTTTRVGTSVLHMHPRYYME